MGLEKLVKRINKFRFNGYLYNQLRRTSILKSTYYRKLKLLIKLLYSSNSELVFYLYRDGDYIQLDIYSSELYEGSIRGVNAYQVYTQLGKIYLQLCSS